MGLGTGLLSVIPEVQAKVKAGKPCPIATVKHGVSLALESHPNRGLQEADQLVGPRAHEWAVRCQQARQGHCEASCTHRDLGSSESGSTLSYPLLSRSSALQSRNTFPTRQESTRAEQKALPLGCTPLAFGFPSEVRVWVRQGW